MDNKKLRLNFAEIEQYRLPVYNKKGVDKIVTFYVLDPDSVLDGRPSLRRIRKKFNSGYPSAKERDAAALKFCHDVSQKLKSGWNPLIQETSNKSWTSVSIVLDRYEQYIKKCYKDGVMTEKTSVDYKSRLRQLRLYLSNIVHADYIYQIDKSFIEGWLEYIYVDKDCSPRTRNNYLTWISTFCTYLVSHSYLSKNPCENINSLRESDKIRKSIPKKDLQKLHDYLLQTNKPFLLSCYICYYTFIRPNEMTHIRLEDISLSEQTIFVSHKFSKNHHDSKVTLPKKVIELMVDLEIFKYPSSYYLFGRNFLPTEHLHDGRIFREYWSVLRTELGFPKEYQFYSLKDSGITAAIDRLGLTITKDQARHTDISTTNHYVTKDQLKSHPEFRNYDGYL